MSPIRRAGHLAGLLLTLLSGISVAGEEKESLWPDQAPGALGEGPQHSPTLTFYRPPAGKANGCSILVLPGGGYARLAPHEGENYARWLADHGVTAAVLQYRLGSAGYRHPAMLNDAARGLRSLRWMARRDGLNPAHVGIIGSSAGGHLASTLLTHFDSGNPAAPDPIERESSRPDFGILCYPVITLGEFTHQGSLQNLLGPEPDPALVAALSNETQVSAQTPPCFIWHTAQDAGVPVENSLHFAAALRRAGVPFELHVFEHGGHGLGLPAAGKKAPPWDEPCLRWLRLHGFLGS